MLNLQNISLDRRINVAMEEAVGAGYKDSWTLGGW